MCFPRSSVDRSRFAGRKDLWAQIIRGSNVLRQSTLPGDTSVSDQQTPLLANEMQQLHGQVGALDTQLSKDAQGLQSMMGALIDELGELPQR